MSEECEYCGKTFRSKQNLKKHIESAKFCLELRGEEVTTKYTCEYCGKFFTQNCNLKTHLKSCAEHKKRIYIDSEIEQEMEKYLRRIKLLRTDLTKEKLKVKKLAETQTELLSTIEKLQNDNNEKDQKIIELEKKLELGKGILMGYEKVKPPNVTTNNTIINQKLANLKVDNIRPLTQATIEEDVPKYTYDLFLKGENGIVQYVTNMTQLKLTDGTIEQNYACTDKSRNTFHRLMESKEWTQDGGARFINEVMNSLADVAEKHWETLFDNMRTATEIFEIDYHQNKIKKLRSFSCSFSNPNGNDREQAFKKIKAKMKDISSV